MNGDFDRAFELVIGHEGGLSMNGKDPGNWTGKAIGIGELKGTKYGISAAAYPVEDIVNLTLERAKKLYKSNYYDHLRCGDMPAVVAFSVFDAGVNCGTSHAAEWLQKLLVVTVDGSIGPMTLQALSHQSAPLIAAKYNALRLQYHASLPGFKDFGRGWCKRIASNILLIGN